MTRKSRINYLKAISHNVERKKMYKAKKQWVVAGISFLVATGLGAVSSHLTTHAAATNRNDLTTKVTPTKLSSNKSNNARSTVASAVQSNAYSLHSQILKNQSNSSKTSNNIGTQKKIPSSAPIYQTNLSAKNSLSAKLSNMNESTSSANTSNVSNNTSNLDSKFAKNKKPLALLSSQYPNKGQGVWGTQNGAANVTLNNGNLYITNGSITNNKNDITGNNWNSNMWNNVKNIYTSGVTAPNGIPNFNSNNTLQSIDLSGINLSHITDWGAEFQSDKNLQSINLGNQDILNVQRMNSAFQSDTKLVSIKGLSDFDVSEAGAKGDWFPCGLWSVFQNDTSLTNLDLSHWNMPQDPNRSNNTDLILAGLNNLQTLKLGNNTLFDKKIGLQNQWINLDSDNPKSVNASDLGDGNAHSGTWVCNAEIVNLQHNNKTVYSEILRAPLGTKAIIENTSLFVPIEYKLSSNNNSLKKGFTYNGGTIDVPVDLTSSDATAESSSINSDISNAKQTAITSASNDAAQSANAQIASLSNSAKAAINAAIQQATISASDAEKNAEAQANTDAATSASNSINAYNAKISQSLADAEAALGWVNAHGRDVLNAAGTAQQALNSAGTAITSLGTLTSGSVKTNSANISTLQTSYNTLSRNIAGNLSKINQDETNIKNNSNDIDTLNQDYSTLSGDYSTLQQNIQAASQLANQANGKATNNQQWINNNGKPASTSANKADTWVNNNGTTVSNRANEASTSADTNAQNIQALSGKVNTDEGTLTTASTNASTALNKAKAALTSLTSVASNASVTALKASYNQLNSELNNSGISSEVSSLKAQASTLGNTVNDKSSGVSALDSYYSQLSGVVSAINNLADEANNIAGDANTQAESNQSWISSNSASLSSASSSANEAYTSASAALSAIGIKVDGSSNGSNSNIKHDLSTINTTLNDASSAIKWVNSNSANVTDNISSLANEKTKVRSLAIQVYSDTTNELNQINNIVGNSKSNVNTGYSNAEQAIGQLSNAAKDAVADVNIIQSEINTNSGNINSIQQQLSSYSTVSANASNAMSSLTTDSAELSWLSNSESALSIGSSLANSINGWVSNNSASVSDLSTEWASVNAQIGNDSKALNDAINTKANQTSLDNDYSTLSGDITTASSIATAASTQASSDSSAISSLNSLSVEAFFASSTADGDVLIDANGNKEVGAAEPAFIGKLADFRNNNQLASVVPKNYHLTAHQKLGLKMISLKGIKHLVLGDTQDSNLYPVITVYGRKASDVNKGKKVVQPTNASDAKNNVQTNANAGYVTVETIKMSNGQKISDTYNLVTENNNNVGDKYTINPQPITNYTFDSKDSTRNLSGVMNDDGSLTTNTIVKLVYEANAAQPITIDYQDQSGNLVKSNVLNGNIDEHGTINNLNALPTNIQSDYTLNNPIKYTFETVAQNIVANVTGKSAQQIINQHNNGKQPIKPVTPQPIPSDKSGSNTNPASDGNNPLNPKSTANNHVDSDNAKIGVATINIVEYNNDNPRKIVKEYALPINVFNDIKNTTGKNAQVGDIDNIKASDSSINPQGFSSSDSNKQLSIKINADGSLSPYNATFNYNVNENNIAPVNVTYKTSDGTDITLSGSQLPKGQYSATLSTNDLASLGGAGSTVDIIPLLKKLSKVPTNYHFSDGETCNITLQAATPKLRAVSMVLGITSNSAEQVANSSANVVISSNSSAVNSDVSSANSFMSNSAISGSARASISNDINIINSASSAIQSDMNKGTSAESSANDALASASSANANISSIASSVANSIQSSSASASASSSVANLASLVANDVKANQPANTGSVSLTSSDIQNLAKDINIQPVTNTVVDSSALTSLTNEVATNNSEINSLANKPAPTATVNYGNFDNLINNGIDKLEDTINTDLKATINHTATAKTINEPITRGFKQVKKHIRWIMITKSVKLYSKNGEARTLRPSKVTLDVKSVYRAHGHFVFKVSYHHHTYFMADNHSTFKNAYLPKTHKLIGKRVRVLNNVYAYRHKASDRVRTLHRGFTGRIKNIVRLGKYNMTRIQLSNGNWISANKNFVKVL